jgi:uncharacterized repeat protein (TIGR01451 family)
MLFLAVVRSAIAQDFNFTLEPKSLTLVPGQSASFVVTVTPFGGFTNEVTLSVTNLPFGVTANFSPQTLTPPGTSLLTLNATTNAANGSFMLDLTAIGGGITNMASSSVSVSFGLLPLCYGAFAGTVTDATTGKPIAGATVDAYGYQSTTDASGQYLITNLALSGSENLPEYYSITAASNGYYSSNSYSYAVCDATNTVDFQLVLEEGASISGTIVDADTLLPLTNVSIYVSYQYSSNQYTGATGQFDFQSLALGTDNTPVNYSVQTQPTGYWYLDTNTIVQANSNSVLNLMVVPVCYQTVYGSVIYSNTGLPATNITVEISTLSPYNGYYDYLYDVTDTKGDYIFTNVTLGYDNVPRTAAVVASAADYYSESTNVALTECLGAVVGGGAPAGSVNAGVLALAPVPPPPPVTNNYGALEGFIYDVQTGLPITNAEVFIIDNAYTSTGSNGAYLMTNIIVGQNLQTNQGFYLEASATGYFQNASNVVVDANETNMQNIYLLRIGYGGIQGTVLNATTFQPVSNVLVIAGNVEETTGTNGQYSTGPLSLTIGNAPTYESITAEATGYWTAYTNTTITNGITNIVNIDLIQVCTGATIVGNVVNALTQAPITNATITTYSGQYYLSVMTDSNGNFILTNITVGNNNSPIQSTLTASAPGFNPQSKTVTIFCDATISTTFGAPETVFGAVEGYVTNVLTGQPLTNVFIGSSFGGATTTDTNGFYFLGQVPLGAGGSNRSWTVTAIPSDFPEQTKSFVAEASTTNVLDFGFGQPLTELLVSARGTPDPVTVGSNLLYTITLTNLAADATNVVLSNTLPANVSFVSASVSNSPGGVFSTPFLTNGVVVTMASNLSSNSGVVLLITVTPTAAGILTNSVTVSSDTPDIVPGATNHNAIVITPATAPVEAMYADLGLTMTGAPNPVAAGSQLTYKLTVTNIGPSTAQGVVVTDTLPANVTFSSAVVESGEYTLIPNGIEWDIGTMAALGTASATFVVIPSTAGEVTNIATVSIGPATPPVTDTNLANNTATVITTITGTTPTNELTYGPIVFNPQTGLYQQTVQYNNLEEAEAGERLGGPPTVEGVRVYVVDLASHVELYNATGTSNGMPYVEYDNTVPPGGNVVFLLEYYDNTRQTFTSTNFMATAVVATTVPLPTGTTLQLDRTPFLSEGQLTIEFASTPGSTYVVEYSSDMKTWVAAVPPIVAKNTRTVWVDSGPPVTASPPGTPGQRFYRIVQTK